MKKLSIMRALILTLAIAMVFPLVACAGGDADTEVTTDPSADTTGTSVTTAVTTEAGKADPLPADVNFGNQQLRFLYWSDREHEEFFTDEPTGEIVEDAIFTRNNNVEQRLGIEIVWDPQDGDSGNLENWVKRMETIHADNSLGYTCFGTYSLSAAAAAVAGYCANLLGDDCEYLNFDDPTYWPKRLISEVTFGDNLYFCSGDISANALYMMYVCYCNTDILREHDLQNPQELVEDGNWTYSKFIKYCENIYEDIDGIEGKTNGDKFGYMSSGIHNDPWFYGTGAVIAEYNSDGELVVSPSLFSPEVSDTFSRIHNLFWTSEDGIYTSSVEHQDAFGEGRLLFMTERCRVTFKVLTAKNYDVKYCILPCPKYNAKQESYVTVMGNPFTLYGIFANATEENRKMGAAFLEYYAYESYKVVTPAVFELSLKAKYVQDDVSAAMYDIVRENLTFDIGRIFSNTVLKTAGGQGIIRNLFKTSSTPTWASNSARYTPLIQTQLTLLQDTLEK